MDQGLQATSEKGKETLKECSSASPFWTSDPQNRKDKVMLLWCIESLGLG